MPHEVASIPLPNLSSEGGLAVRAESVALSLPHETFIAGSENRLLAAVLGQWCNAVDLSAAGDPTPWQQLASPLVLVGSTGSGKSHLSAGLAHQAAKLDVHHTLANDLRREHARAVQSGKGSAWRNQLTSKSLLILDDIDHLPTRGAFSEEFVSLLDQLHETGGKLVVTTAQPLAHLRGWPPAVVSRLAAGLTVEISPLGPASRKTLLSRLAGNCGWRLCEATLQHLADAASPEPRELLHMMNDLRRQFGDGASLDVTVLDHFLRLRKTAHAPPLREIVRAVARHYKLPIQQLTSSNRQRAVVLARAVVTLLARQLTSASYDEIGQTLGGRDHTTIMHSHQQALSRLETEPPLRVSLEELTTQLRR